MFHGGVEVFDTEWSLCAPRRQPVPAALPADRCLLSALPMVCSGYCEERRSGVYPCAPKQNTMYTFRESVTLGVTQLSRKQVHPSIVVPAGGRGLA